MAAAEWGTMCFIEGVLMSLVMLLTVNVQASVADCPDDIFQNTDTGKATTVVNWQANDTTCDLLSGSRFSIGSTNITCTDENGNDTCIFTVTVNVQPPADYIFIDNPRTSSSVSCMTVVWPASKDGENKEYALYYWRKGTPKPDSSERIVVTPQQGDITYTFNRQEICSLFPGDLYVVEVSEESGDAISSVEHWTRPRTPRWISVVSGTSSSTSVELTWERVSLQNLEQYRVYLNMYTGYRPTSTIDLGYVSKTTDRLVVDSLRPGAAFDACVSAVVGSGDMRLESRPQSRYINLGSLRESELLAYNFTESTIAVAWRTASGTKNQNDPYMLHIDPDDADENYLAVFNPSGSLAFSEFVGLKPNTEYKINLFSNLGLILGTSQKTRPGRVANVRPMLVTDDAINLEWDAPTEGDVDSYELHISPGENSEPIKAWGTSCYFSSLTAKTEYFFKIFSVYDGMKSVPQTIMVTGGVTKAHASTPVNVVATAVGTVLSFPSIVLTIGIVILCLKYRRLKNSNDSRATVAVSFNPKEDLTDDYQDSRHYQARIKETEGVDYAVPDVDGSSHMTLDPS
ncbi:fibronectin-like isoform X2 [Acanthaster planci]|uniref:Fibronectin-like isoform X2 n=1 Tax=Acanthaster planci TaxID=133434 RepID=A0A8B8A259_ACAPL|nr:fibronectin-like isoform X2 [Acanthaster planci]